MTPISTYQDNKVSRSSSLCLALLLWSLVLTACLPQPTFAFFRASAHKSPGSKAIRQQTALELFRGEWRFSRTVFSLSKHQELLRKAQSTPLEAGDKDVADLGVELKQEEQEEELKHSMAITKWTILAPADPGLESAMGQYSDFDMNDRVVRQRIIKLENYGIGEGRMLIGAGQDIVATETKQDEEEATSPYEDVNSEEMQGPKVLRQQKLQQQQQKEIEFVPFFTFALQLTHNDLLVASGPFQDGESQGTYTMTISAGPTLIVHLYDTHLDRVTILAGKKATKSDLEKGGFVQKYGATAAMVLCFILLRLIRNKLIPQSAKKDRQGTQGTGSAEKAIMARRKRA